MQFPAGFVWGAATSAFQIEGASQEDGKGPSIWDTFCRQPGRVADGATGDVAIDHYHRHREDVALLAGLGYGAYRFSISWPRVLRLGRGAVNRAGLGFYDQLVDDVLEAGLDPYPTLYHWDLPQALQDEGGGWPARVTAARFADYAALMVERLGDRVTRWATLNEPWCSAYLGHASGVHAPGVQDARAAVASAHHLLLGHGLATAAMRATRAEIQVGLVLNPAPVVGVDGVSDDTVRRVDGLRNRWFLDAVLTGTYPADVVEDLGPVLDDLIEPGDLETIAAPLDWLGVNYYHDIILGPVREPSPWEYPFTPPAALVAETELVTDLAWPVTPYGLADLLCGLRDTYPTLPPIAITENGAAFDDRLIDGRVADDRRIAYLTAHLEALATAMADGVDVFGYFVWSAFDNLEWHDGYRPRFGVIHVDYQTMVRTPKDSARWLRQVIDDSRPPPP